MLDRSTEPGGRPSPRQPIFNIPSAVTGVLILLVGIHLLRLALPDDGDAILFRTLAFVPGRLVFAVAPEHVLEALTRLAERGAAGYRLAQVGRYFLADGSPQPWTLVTYALLHAGWAHVGLNAVWLLAFGSPVARRLGPLRFLLFLALGAIAGAVAQAVAHPFDLLPVIGASAAVSASMGAALRFMFQPHLPLVATLDPRTAEPPPALRPLRVLLTDRRALIFLAAWFATNLLFGLGAITIGDASGPVAWEAHIGGFLAGLLLLPLFERSHSAPPADAAPSAPEEPPPGV